MSAAHPDTSTIDCSLPCVCCGYNLRTLPSSGRCPECGSAVELTLSLGGELAKTRPAYVRRLAWASGMLLLVRVAVFIALLLSLLRRDPGPETFVAFILASLLCASGTWLLTTCEHPHVPPRLAKTAWAMRIMTLLASTLFIPAMVCALGWVPSWPDRRLLGYGLSAAVMLYVIYPALEMRIMTDLSRRVSDKSLGQRALVSGTTAAVSGTLICLIQILINLSNPYDPLQWLSYTLGALVCILLVSWLWSAWNCLLARRIFVQASPLAAAR
jgi:hypothetical protein